MHQGRQEQTCIIHRHPIWEGNEAILRYKYIKVVPLLLINTLLLYCFACTDVKYQHDMLIIGMTGRAVPRVYIHEYENLAVLTHYLSALDPGKTSRYNDV